MAKDIKRHITHLKSKVVENNAPKLISGSDIYEGEIAVNYAKGYETLSIKNESGETVTFLPRPYNSARGGETIHPIFDGTGTAGGTNLSAAWSGNCADIKTLYDGLTILYKIKSAGHASGDTLSINGGEAHKVLLNASTQLTTHYPVNSIIKLTYDSTESASFYTGSTTQKTTTGVWKIENYDSNTTYSTGSSAILSAGTDTTQRVWRADQLKAGMNALYQPKGSYVTTGRKVSAGTGLSGGGDLSSDRTISLATTGTAGTYKQVVVDAYGRVTSGNTADNNTWRSIKVNGTNFLTDTSTALNLSGGSNVTLTTGSTGLLTIAATDTKYTAATAAPGKVATNSASGTSTNYARQDHTHGIDLATGDSNGQVKIAGTNVSVKGLGTAAYKAEGYFAGSGHTHSAYVPTGRTITTASGLTGGGNLSADRTIGLVATGTAGTYYCVKTDAYGRVTSGNTSNPNTDTKVAQTNTTANGSYEVLLAGSTATATTTEGASKNVGIAYNPSTSALTVNKKITTIAANNFITGTGTAATTGTSGSSTVYYPAKWTFNKGTTVADGDIFTIKIPVAGHSYGVYISLNNGTNYYPVVLNGTSRLTTQYPVNNYMTVVYETGGTAASIYPVTGGTATGTSAAGVFRVVNFYDSNSTDISYTNYNNVLYKAAETVNRYQVCFKKDETSYIPASSTNNTTANTKTITTTEFDPFGVIFYFSSAGTVSANANFPSGTLHDGYAVDLRFSFNVANVLTAQKDVYAVCVPQSNGKVKFRNPTTSGITNSPISQTLPTSDDGYVYIYLGAAYNTSSIFLAREHPVYQFKGGALRQYVGSFGTMAFAKTGDYVVTGRSISTASGLTGGGNLSANRTIGLAATGTAGTYKQVVVDAYGRVTSGNTADNNTWRSIKVNGTNFLTDTSTALNLSGGSNVTLTTGSTGLLTIAATDTKYTAATAAPGKVATNSASGTSTNYARQDHTHGIDLATGDANGQVKIAGTNVSVKGLGGAAYLNTGTTSSTVAAGNHNHSGTYATNAFKRIAVNGTNVDADSTGDTFTITAGTFVSLTGDATNDKMTIGVSTGTSSSTLARGDHSHASSKITSMGGYSMAASGTAITTADTLNQAIGKLEKQNDEIVSYFEDKEEATAAALTDLDSRKADIGHTHGVQVLNGIMTTVSYNDGDGQPRWASYVSMTEAEARKVISFQYMVTNQGGGFDGNKGCVFFSKNGWGYAKSYTEGSLTITNAWFHLWGAGNPGIVYYNLIKRI
jgi:hypothetical protein